MGCNHNHFGDDDPLEHVMKKKAQGGETHGTDAPGHLAALADGLREGGLVFLLVTFAILPLSPSQQLLSLSTFAVALIAWKTGRSAWMGWARLERLHSVMVQEKYEIENNREQERLELIALYKAKGFDGKLLEDVVDVLMADNDRLLKVMLEEEMGLSLASYEHPLKQALGAFLGASISLSLGVASFYFFGVMGVFVATLFSLLGGVTLTSLFEKNEWIPAAVWNLALATLSGGISYFLAQILHIGNA